jgi:hypothetical protein
MAETRTITTHGDAALPDDDYALAEAYCGDPQCDCRRVMLNILGRRQGHVVTIRFGISFGFDRDDEMAGPFLDPLNPQRAFAGVLLRLVTQVLADPAYVARLEAHYYQVKGITAAPTPAVREVMAQWGGGEEPKLPRVGRSRRKKSARRKR